MRIGGLASLLAAFALAPAAQAIPVSYGIDYVVEFVDTSGLGPPPDPRVAVGNVYGGSFTVDSAVLAQDGINKSAAVSAFATTMEDVSWILGVPGPASEFAGFRGPNGLGDVSPGFDVVGGQITNLRGGVFGRADFPFIDFSLDVRLAATTDPTCTTGSFCGNSPHSFWTLNPLGGFGGTMRIFAVPEPAGWALVLLGCAVGGTLARRRHPAGTR
jgi:hypothetical protein